MVRRTLTVLVVVAGVLLLAVPAGAQYDPSRITISTASTGPGGSFTVSGCCFDPGSSVEVIFNSTPVLLGTVTASSIGEVSGSFAVPTGAELGAHTVDLVGTKDGRPLVLSTAIEVRVGAAAGAAATPSGAGSAPAATGAELPRTGADTQRLLSAIGATAIVGGGLLVIAARRRRPALTA